MAFRFLQSIFTSPNQPGKFDKDLMLRGIERVVDGTDPRLRAVSHYRRKLWDSVEHAIDYVVTFVNTLPPAINADRQGYMTDPRLRALFASPESLREILSFSDGTRNYLKQAPDPLPVELYAGLGAVRVEKTSSALRWMEKFSGGTCRKPSSTSATTSWFSSPTTNRTPARNS